MNSEGVPGLDWHRGSPHGLLTRPLTVTRKRSLLIRTLILIGAQSVVPRSSSLTRRLLICASWFCLLLSIKVLPWPCHFYFECWKASPGTSGGNFFAKLGSLKLKLPKLFTLFLKSFSDALKDSNSIGTTPNKARSQGPSDPNMYYLRDKIKVLKGLINF